MMGPNARWQIVLIYTVPVRAKELAVDAARAALDEGAIGVGCEAGLEPAPHLTSHIVLRPNRQSAHAAKELAQPHRSTSRLDLK